MSVVQCHNKLENDLTIPPPMTLADKLLYLEWCLYETVFVSINS